MNKLYLPAVLTISLLITIGLTIASFRINFWPTDSELAYIPSATRVFTTPFISDLHHATLFHYNIMHGKEALIVAIAIAQRVLNDYESLFPNILVLILAAGGSGILLFLILRRLVSERTALWTFLLYCTTFWTYQYVLQGAHQPLVMFNCLLTIYGLFQCDGRRRFYLFTGAAFGLMLFSSPTAAVYGPYLLAAFVYTQRTSTGHVSWRTLVVPVSWMALGTVAVILIFTLPNPVENFKLFLRFLSDCQQGNHFQVVSKSTGLVLPRRGVGIEWIVRYFTLIMPVLFAAYLLSLGLLAKRALEKRGLWVVIVLSLSTPVAVELIGVAQFGRNYFSWLLGLLLAVAFAVETLDAQTARRRLQTGLLLSAVFVMHTAFNALAFFGDVLPSRMAVTYIHDWLASHPGEKYTYLLHPHNVNIGNVINHPNEKNKVLFKRINSISEAKDGYMLVPMSTGKSIYVNCAYPDFMEDPQLTRLMNSKDFKRYVAASFPTMASSRFWPQEEEYCSYLDLIQGGISQHDRAVGGYVWILDAGKLQRDWKGFKF